MSEGTIYNLLNKVANIVLPIYEGIKEEVEKASTVGGDESGVKVNSVNYWAWTWQTILQRELKYFGVSRQVLVLFLGTIVYFFQLLPLEKKV